MRVAGPLHGTALGSRVLGDASGFDKTILLSTIFTADTHRATPTVE